MWLAKTGYERIEETEDPELGIERLMETYLKKRYSTAWIHQRLKALKCEKSLPTNGKTAALKKKARHLLF